MKIVFYFNGRKKKEFNFNRFIKETEKNLRDNDFYRSIKSDQDIFTYNKN